MKRGFVYGLLLGLAIGASISLAGIFGYQSVADITDRKTSPELIEGAQVVIGQVISGTNNSNNPQQITQMASEGSMMLQYIQIKQNDLILQKLDELINQSRK